MASRCNLAALQLPCACSALLWPKRDPIKQTVENKKQYFVPWDLFDSADVSSLWRSNLLSHPHYSGGQTALAFPGSFILQTSNYLWRTENTAVNGLGFFFFFIRPHRFDVSELPRCNITGQLYSGCVRACIPEMWTLRSLPDASLTTKPAKAASVDDEETAGLLDLDRVFPHCTRHKGRKRKAMAPQFHSLHVLKCVFWKVEQAMWRMCEGMLIRKLIPLWNENRRLNCEDQGWLIESIQYRILQK